MIKVFDDVIHVHYGFVFLSDDGDVADLLDARVGQVNGLLGAQLDGQLSLLTGLHTGRVPLRVEWLDQAPPVDDDWEDIVEVSFEITQTDMILSAFDVFLDVTIPATGMHRARFSGSYLDAGKEVDTILEGMASPDSYLLQLWPADGAPDAIVKQTSMYAEYWRKVARQEA